MQFKTTGLLVNLKGGLGLGMLHLLHYRIRLTFVQIKTGYDF